jgi:hypothetical protein
MYFSEGRGRVNAAVCQSSLAEASMQRFMTEYEKYEKQGLGLGPSALGQHVRETYVMLVECLQLSKNSNRGDKGSVCKGVDGDPTNVSLKGPR